MIISETNYREEILAQACRELKSLGVRIKPEKCKTIEHKRSRSKKFFAIPLHNLELAEGILSTGEVVKLPKFLLFASSRIQTDLQTEGLFRKNGSVKKQESIIKHLEGGGNFDKSHHVIDTANVLKKFFASLPSPIIPLAIQDSLINCLIKCPEYEHKLEAVLLTILFLDPLALNTVAYFCQFLNQVTKNAHENLMTAANIAKILAPTIMSGNDNVIRLKSLIEITEMLINHSSLIGIVPNRMIRNEMLPPPQTEERKKHKRRSASLNRVFKGLDGIRKRVGNMVGAISGSPRDSLDKSDENLLDTENSAAMTPCITKSAKKRRLEKMDGVFSSRKKKDHPAMKLQVLPEIDDNATTRSPLKGLCSKNLCVELEKQTPETDYVRVPKIEYEAFKNRLHTIETRIHQEFQVVKLHSVKAEMNKSNANAVEKVESKFHETLQEVEKIEDPERHTEILAKRLSRDLKIHNPVVRSPSARKISSIRRKSSTTRLSRGNSWYKSTAITDNPKESVTFNPKTNLERLRVLPNSSSVPANAPQTTTEKVIPEKPARKTAINSLGTESEKWTNATEFFNDFEQPIQASISEPQQHAEEVFKTPTRVKKLQIKGDIDINKTPMLPPMAPITPLSKSSMSGKKIALMTTPVHEGREARESIIQIRHHNAGQVAQKAKLFDTLLDSQMKSVERIPVVRLPRVAINRKIENIKNSNVPSTRKSPRRSSRSPGVNRRLQLRPATQKSPLLKIVKETRVGNRESRLNILKNSELVEFTSPSRKAISQTNSPRRGRTGTPTSAKKNNRSTPKSPRSATRRRQDFSFEL